MFQHHIPPSPVAPELQQNSPSLHLILTYKHKTIRCVGRDKTVLPGASGYEKQRVGALMKLAVSHRRVINAERKCPFVTVCVSHFPRFNDRGCFCLAPSVSQLQQQSHTVRCWHFDLIDFPLHRSDETRHRIGLKKKIGLNSSFLFL